MSDRVRTIDIQIGQEVPDPKLGVSFKFLANSAAAKENVASVSNFQADGTYFFIKIRSSNPTEMKASFQRFLETAIGVVKEMSPEVDEMLGTSSFDVS